ncbi:hypothetical protein R3P38DRAFT_3351344 [Favolaschia claudopus]|uniref:Transposase n=1 Tax=Favolaschia claudopus TaxID=2862362 RepID=A0AAW0CBP2_9AGAR
MATFCPLSTRVRYDDTTSWIRLASLSPRLSLYCPVLDMSNCTERNWKFIALVAALCLDLLVLPESPGVLSNAVRLLSVLSNASGRLSDAPELGTCLPGYHGYGGYICGVDHYLSDSEDQWETDGPSAGAALPSAFSTEDSDSDSDLELTALNLDEAALADCISQEESRRTALWELLGLRLDMDKKDWKRAEAKRSLGYNGQARSTKYKQAQKERERAAESVRARASTQAKRFGFFFTPLASAPSPSLPCPPSLPSLPSASSIPTPTASLIFPSDVPASIPSYSCHSLPPFNDTALQNPPSLYGYFSDEASEPDFSEGDEENSENKEEPQPKKKRRKLDVSVREQKQLKKEKRKKDMSDGLTAIEKHLALKRTQFQSPLQQKRGRVVQSTLHLVVRNGRKLMDASAMAAETHGFAAAWGSRLAREWTAEWIESRTLPESDRGRHAKTWSLLNDPEVREELAGYLRTNKWSMKPDKLVEYSKAKLVTDEMKKFVQNEVNEAMPRGLKKYLEMELFPRIGYKVARGISVNTARRWLHEQGFQYTEKDKGPLPPGQYWLVLTAQDEMTAQANDGDKWKWIMEGENPTRKKGVGRGIHRSDVICSTVGHIVDGGEQIEYGKNYDGFWDGPQFIKQLRDRIIPGFEKLHDRNIYRACFLIDNSNGHCAYAVDALLASRMNWRSGGKQAMLRDGWFWKDGLKIVQKMVLPSGEAKGMKLVLEERGLFHSKLKMKCGWMLIVKASGKEI